MVKSTRVTCSVGRGEGTLLCPAPRAAPGVPGVNAPGFEQYPQMSQFTGVGKGLTLVYTESVRRTIEILRVRQRSVCRLYFDPCGP